MLISDTLWFYCYFSVYVCTWSDFLLCSSEMCITPSTAVPSRIYSPELLRKVNSDQSFPIPRDVRKNYFDYVFGVPGINMRIYLKLNIPENVNVKEKTVKTTMVTDVRIGVLNVQSLGNKLDCVIDHITHNRIDIVGITETWLSNDDKNNMSVVNTCLNNGYTLLHRPRNIGRRGGEVSKYSSTTRSTSNRG